MDANTLPKLVLRVDRSRALARGAWRVAMAIGIAVILLTWDVRWRLLWLTDKAAFFSSATFFALGAGVSLMLLYGGIRWLRLAASRGTLGITLGPEGLLLELGPFGEHRFDAARLRFGLDREIELDLFDMLPDDAFTPTLRHSGDSGELLGQVMKFTGLSAETLNTRIRPYIRDALARQQNA